MLVFVDSQRRELKTAGLYAEDGVENFPSDSPYAI